MGGRERDGGGARGREGLRGSERERVGGSERNGGGARGREGLRGSERGTEGERKGERD